MTDKRLQILQHALGVDQYGRGQMYRSHFVAGLGGDDYEVCKSLAEDGLMIDHVANEISGGDPVFVVTPAGRKYVTEHSPAPPKLTRSQRRYEAFLADDSGMRFGDWLRCRGAK